VVAAFHTPLGSLRARAGIWWHGGANRGVPGLPGGPEA
jgi:hypothetical protein